MELASARLEAGELGSRPAVEVDTGRLVVTVSGWEELETVSAGAGAATGISLASGPGWGAIELVGSEPDRLAMSGAAFFSAGDSEGILAGASEVATVCGASDAGSEGPLVDCSAFVGGELASVAFGVSVVVSSAADILLTSLEAVLSGTFVDSTLGDSLGAALAPASASGLA